MKLRTALLLVGLPLGLVALGFTIPDTNAQTNSWINSTAGFWQDPTSWSLKLLPDSTQSMLITNAGNKTVFVDSSTASGYPNTMTVSDLILAGQDGSQNLLLVDNIGSNPPLHILNSLIVNPGGALLAINSALLVDNAAGGAVDVEDTMELSGTNFLSGGLYLAFPTNAAASVSVIDGQTSFTNGYMTIGFYGSAQVTLLGCTLQTEDYISVPNGVFVGFGPGSQGTLSVLAGTLLVPEHLSLGEDAGSSGLLSLDGGQLIATNNFLISIGGNGNGHVVVSNAPVAASYLIVGDSLGSSGTLTIAGGTVNLSGAMAVAQGQGATGSVFITGGQLTVTNQGVSVTSFETGRLSLTIGSFGVGQMTLSNGSLLAQSVIVGNCENSQGTLTIAGGTASAASTLTAGVSASITNGGASRLLNIVVSNATGVIDVTGGSLTITNGSGTGLLTIGQLGSGFFVQSGGTVQADQLAIASASTSIFAFNSTNVDFYGGTGQAVLSNGLILAQAVTVGLATNSQGTLAIAGGAMSVASNMAVGVFPYATGVVQVTGGSLTVTNQSGTAQLVVGLAGVGTFAQSGGVVTVNQLLVTNGTYSVSSSQVVEPLWAIITNGTYSTFSLSLGVFNTGATTVNNAEPFLVGDAADSATYHLLGGVHSFANGIEVRSSAVLSGCGTVNGSVLVDAGGAVVADCGGTLTFTGIVTNNGAWTALNGSVFESYGPMVNNGLINALNGNTNFHAGFVNNGILLTSNSIPQIVSITADGSNIDVQFTTVAKLMYILEYTSDLVAGNWTPLIGYTGQGGNVTLTDFNALLQPQRFYRVHMLVLT